MRSARKILRFLLISTLTLGLLMIVGCGTDGKDGITPHIGENGNWWIGDSDTGVCATGPKGDTGDDGKTPYIGENGNWWIGDTDLGVYAGGTEDPEKPNTDLKVSKSASHTAARTAYPGEKIEYFITVENSGAAAQQIVITDTVPENTAYVSGADANDGGKLSWDTVVPAGKSATVSYTVIVDNDLSLCDGGMIESTAARIGDLEALADTVYIERTLNKLDIQYLDIAIDALSASKFSDRTLAMWIYYVAYTKNPVSADVFGSSFEEALNTVFSGSASAALLDAVAPTLYGGTDLARTIDGIKGAPCESVNEADLVPGDIVVRRTDTATEAFIYGSNGLFNIASGCVKVDTASALASLTGSDLFAVFRPSTLLTTFTPQDPDKEPDVLTEKQQAIVDTAKYYLLRGEWAQYDDTYYCNNSTELGNESRWKHATHTPEEYTEDYIAYLNCAAFTHDVYWTVFGKELPGSMYTTKNLANNSGSYGMKVYAFTRTAGQVHTAEEMETVTNEFLSVLEPGDLMVVRRANSSGHVMLYIGDGVFIHSTGSSYSYGGSYGVETYEPTLRFAKVRDYFLSPATPNGYIFGENVTGLHVVRPLNNSTWANYSVTEIAQNRLDNLQGIIAQKLSSVKNHVTVNCGDEITYTFRINNTNGHEVTLTVTDVVPASTVYVSGADSVNGDELSWTVTVPARKTVEVSFTVRVSGDARDGEIIANDGAMICGVPFKMYSICVKNTLTESEQQTLINAFEELKAEGTELRGIEFVNELYKRAFGVESIFADTDHAVITEGADGIFSSDGLSVLSNGKQAYTLNDEGRYLDMLVSGLFGGRGVTTGNETITVDGVTVGNNIGIRTGLATGDNLVVGDILLGRTSTSRVMYLYLGGDHFINLTTLSEETTTVNGRLERLPAYSYHYAVLRPSFSME